MNRIPPSNIDAEQSVLAACLTGAELPDNLKPADFYDPKHSTIYATITDLINQNKPVDLITIKDALGTELKDIGGVVYLATLTNMTVPNANYHAKIVRDLAKKRRIITAGKTIVDMGYSNMELDDYRTTAEQALLHMTEEKKGQSGPEDIGSILTSGLTTELLNAKPGEYEGIQTPWRDLNNLIVSIGPGEFAVIAGRPSMGKTAMGLQIGYYAAQNHGPVAFFSLEMSKELLVKRILSMQSRVGGHYIRTRILNDMDRQRITDSTREIVNKHTPLYIDDTSSITVSQVRNKAWKIKQKKGLAAIVIDYLQLMRGSGKAGNREQEIAEISRGLKNTAKDLQVPVIALSQLSRGVENRQDKRPQLSDLRESGSIEQDSDTVIFLYRDEYYNAETEKRGIADVIVRKNRNGPIGTVELAWMKEFTMFLSLARRGGV